MLSLFLGLKGDVEAHRILGSVETWGPQYRISFDLMINSLVPGNTDGWSSVLRFKRKGAGNAGFNGERVPSININKNRMSLNVANLDGMGYYYYDIAVELNKWYNIILQQKVTNGQVQIN